MARASARSEQEIEQLLKGYEESGLTRREYCAGLGIPVTTFDYYRNGRARKSPRRKAGAKASLVRVDVQSAAKANVEKASPTRGFIVSLPKGRSIESDWNYTEADLTRLIQIVEAA